MGIVEQTLRAPDSRACVSQFKIPCSHNEFNMHTVTNDVAPSGELHVRGNDRSGALVLGPMIPRTRDTSGLPVSYPEVHQTTKGRA